MSSPEFDERPRVAPQNLEAEESVLGAALISSAAYFAVVATGLRSEDFYREAHGRIFDAIGKLAHDREPTDPVAVAALLESTEPPESDSRSANMLDAIGGKAKIHELAALTPATANAPHHAKIVREQALRRALIRTTSAASRKALDGGSFDEALDVFEQEIERHRSRSAVRANVQTGRTLAERFCEKRMNPPDEDTEGIAQPSKLLSRRLKPGSMYVVGGYTGDGKTCAGLDFLKSACVAGHRAGYASLEMTGDELADRLVASFGIPYSQAQSGRLDAKYHGAAAEAEKAMSAWDFDVLDDEEVDPQKLRRWAVAGKYDLVVIDHLHRIEFADRFEIEKTVRSIRNMAKRLEIPVVLLAQLSRTGDKKNPYPPPTLASLRETSVVEQEAALVGFVYRERGEDDPNLALPASRWIVAKNRFGGTGTRPLVFKGEFQRFDSAGYVPRAN